MGSQRSAVVPYTRALRLPSTFLPLFSLPPPVFSPQNNRKSSTMADKKNIIPVKLGDFSVLDSEFNSIRERFDAEMRKMEDEMTKFRSELLNREQSSVFSKSSTTTSSSSSTTSSNANANALAAPTSSDWLTGLHSPLIQEDGEEKKLKLASTSRSTHPKRSSSKPSTRNSWCTPNTKRKRIRNRCIANTTANSCCPKEPIRK